MGGSMRSGLWAGAALAAVFTAFTAAPAWAIVVVTPTDTITVDGSYSTGLGVGAPPFIAGPFTLSFSVPASGFASTGSLLFESTVGTGSYTNGGTTTTFTNGQLNSFNPSLGNDGFQVGGYIGPITSSSVVTTFTVTTTAPLFTTTAEPGGTEYSLIPGSYTLASSGNSAFFNIDPTFTGSLVVTNAPNASVPEPSAAALLLAPLGALGLLRRRRA